jgi:hypothetical protein
MGTIRNEYRGVPSGWGGSGKKRPTAFWKRLMRRWLRRLAKRDPDGAPRKRQFSGYDDLT